MTPEEKKANEHLKDMSIEEYEKLKMEQLLMVADKWEKEEN